MPNKLTPPPPTGIGILDRWLALLYQLLTATGQILWPQVSKAGSNLTDIETRNHADLQNLNTASYTHLTAANHTDLTDGNDSTLHFHATDRARANHTGTQESDTVLVSRIGSPTYTTLQHFVNLSQSAGRISGGALSDAGSANLNVAAGTGWLRIADDDVSDLKFFNWTASNGNAIPAGTTRYVGVEYNAGSPQVVIKTTDTWNEDTEFQLGEVSNESGTLHIINNPFWVGDAITNIIQRFSAMQHVARDNTFGGLILGETGTRNVTVTAGHIWSRLNDFHFNAFNSSSGGTFDRYYRNGAGGFTREVAQTQWPNTQYDDGSGTLVTMTNNRYANLWLYAETDGDVVMLYGQNQYTNAANAEVEAPPSTIPTRLQSTGLLIGRIIFQKSAAAATTVSSAFSTIFNPVAATDHNLLANLQGGTPPTELFHLTSAEYTGTGTGVFVRKTGGAIDPVSTGAVTPGTGAFTTLSSSGNATLGDSTSVDSHTINGTTLISANSASNALEIRQTGAGNALVVEDSTNPDATPTIIDAAGNVVIGHTARIVTGSLFEVHSAAAINGTPTVGAFNWDSSASNGPGLSLFKSQSDVTGTFGIVSSGAQSAINFLFDDGVSFVRAADIVGVVDGAPGVTDMPGRLLLRTSPDGASTPIERIRIDSSGMCQVGNVAATGVALSTTVSAKLRASNATYTDGVTATSGTVTHGTINSFDNPAIAATNATVTYTNASTVYIDGAPTNGTNVTISNPWALFIAAGNSAHVGNSSFGQSVAPIAAVDTTSLATNLVTISAATYTVLTSDHTIIQTTAASVYTLPAAASFSGRRLHLVTQFAGTVTSASSNVVPLAGGAAGTAILAATAGKFATLQSDGTNWIIIAAN